jgi:uncharacterized protein YneF (UPF0154 family)
MNVVIPIWLLWTLGIIAVALLLILGGIVLGWYIFKKMFEISMEDLFG